MNYELINDGGNNALTAAGQVLKIPAETRIVSLLLAADTLTISDFSWLDGEGNVLSREMHEISPNSGFIGQWETRTWKKKPNHFVNHKRDYAWLNKCTGVKPGYVNRQRLEWYSTHTHSEGKDQAYKYGYMYTLRLNVVEGAAVLQLPDNPGIQIFAAAASSQTHQVQGIQALTDSYDY